MRINGLYFCRWKGNPLKHAYHPINDYANSWSRCRKSRGKAVWKNAVNGEVVSLTILRRDRYSIRWHISLATSREILNRIARVWYWVKTSTIFAHVKNRGYPRSVEPPSRGIVLEQGFLFNSGARCCEANASLPCRNNPFGVSEADMHVGCNDAFGVFSKAPVKCIASQSF